MYLNWNTRQLSNSYRLSGKGNQEYIKMTDYEEYLDKFENGSPIEKLDVELEIMGRWYYLND